MSTEGWIYVIGGVLLASLLLHQPLLFLVSLILLLTAGVSRLWDQLDRRGAEIELPMYGGVIRPRPG
jgi:hypothetical protein